MIKGKIALERPERFAGAYEIPKEKLTKAIEKATDKLESQIPMFGDMFAPTWSIDCKYPLKPNNNWVCGMFTGEFLLAYELTGNKKFKEVAERQVATYRERIDNKVGVDDHDVGFAFSPSCVGAYKLFGDEKARQTALDAAEYYYNTSYSKKGGFILRSWKGGVNGCRTMMDTLMNIPLLFWAAQETGKQEYFEAAVAQYKTTANYLIREDGSSFHHYQFDFDTHQPVRGLTFQGYADDSCWSRGHAWGVYGFPMAYSYSKDPMLIDLHEGVTNFMLNHLPEDLVPYWDYTFTEGEEPRDSSAGLINVCGMKEMCRYLPDDAPQKPIFENAAAQILEATIDMCTGDIGREYDGLVTHVTAAKPQGLGINECGIYGDYHYLEALCRFVKPDWVRYW